MPYDPSVELWRVICESCGRMKILFKIFGPLSYLKQLVKIMLVKNGEALWLLGVKCGPLWDWCWCHQLENTHSNMQSGSWGGATFILLLNILNITYKRGTPSYRIRCATIILYYYTIFALCYECLTIFHSRSAAAGLSWQMWLLLILHRTFLLRPHNLNCGKNLHSNWKLIN